jgi:hypothetical protein
MEIKGRHTGKRLSKYLLDILIKFDLCEKLFCITTDHASNMRKLMKCISQRLRARGVEWDPDVNFINCMNHVLNLAVGDFLKAIKGLPPSEDKTPSLKEKEDEDEDNDLDTELDDDSDDDEEESEEGIDEELLVNESAIEADEDYDDVDEDFHGTLKKLRGVAKVRNVAHKMSFSALLNDFCMLQ